MKSQSEASGVHEAQFVSAFSETTAEVTRGVQTQWVYNELAEVPVQQVDPIADFYRQLENLRSQQARLQFFVREIRSQIRG